MKNLVSSIPSTPDEDATMAATILCSLKLDDHRVPATTQTQSHQPLVGKQIKEKQPGVIHTKIRKITFRLQEQTYVIQDPSRSHQPRPLRLHVPITKTKKKQLKLSTELNKLIRNIGGSEAVLVVEKRLTKTDVNKSQGRLLIPELQVKNPDLLMESEKEKLRGKEDIEVWVFDPKLDKSALNLGAWKMKSTNNLVLKTNWNLVVAKNGLEENMVVQVWSFRVQQQLCFALVRVAD